MKDFSLKQGFGAGLNWLKERVLLSPRERAQAAAERQEPKDGPEERQVAESEAPWMFARTPPQK